MKLYYFSSFLLLTLFYMVSGQNVSNSGVKTIPQTRVPDTITITRITKTAITSPKKACPTANYTSMEKRCDEQGGKLILDECGYYSICLLPCGDNINTTTTNAKTLTKTLPTSNIIKDYYLKHGVFNGYVYCSCIYSDVKSNYYTPAKPSDDIGVCQRQLELASPPLKSTEVVDPIPVTTTSEEVTSTPITTGKIVPSGKTQFAKVRCQNLMGTLYMNNDASKSVCLLPCKSTGKTIPVTKPNSVTKTIPITKTTGTNPDILYPRVLERRELPKICSCVINLLNSDERISTNVSECVALAEELGYKPDVYTTTTTTTTEDIIPTDEPTTTITEDIIPTDKPTTCPPKALNNVGTLCKQYGGLLVTEGCKSDVCLVPCGAKTVPTSTKKIITGGYSKTLPAGASLPTVVKDDNPGEFNGYVYCSCIYANGSSSGYAAGINSSDMTQCELKLPKGTDFTTIDYKKNPIEVIETPTEAVETPTESVETSKCVPQVVTVTEKEKETITMKETITVTVTVNGEPTPIQCADKRAQCGGKNYKGPTCCPEGYLCRPFTSYYSECVEIGKEY